MLNRYFRPGGNRKWSLSKKIVVAACILFVILFIAFVAIIAAVYQNITIEIQKEKDDAARKNNYENAPLPITINGSIIGRNIVLNVGGSITINDIQGKVNGDGDNTISFTAKKSDDSEKATLPGNSYEAQVWRFLMQHGYSSYAASGLMGCWECEAPGLDPATEEARGSAASSQSSLHGIGIAQWTYERHTALKQFAKKRGSSWKSLKTQLDFFIYESKTSHKFISAQKFKTGMTNLQETTAYAMDHYEQMNTSKLGYMFNPRFSAAKQIFAKFHKFTGGLDVELTGKIKGNKVTITGTINGITAYTEGTYKDGKIRTSGYWGEGADDYMNVGEGVRGMLKFAKRICDDNSFGYCLLTSGSGYNTYCSFCNPGSSKDYCCASFITACINHGLYGKKNKTWARYCHVYSPTAAVSGLKAAIAADSNFKRVSNSTLSMKAGDICFVTGGSHVLMYAGHGKTYDASRALDSRTGDSSGREIHSNSINWTTYEAVYRYVGKDKK